MGKTGGGGGNAWLALHTGMTPGRGGGGGGTLCLMESEVLEESEVEDDEIDTDESKDDFLSGTLGLGLLPDGDLHLMNEGTGVPAVGVFD